MVDQQYVIFPPLQPEREVGERRPARPRPPPPVAHRLVHAGHGYGTAQALYLRYWPSPHHPPVLGVALSPLTRNILQAGGAHAGNIAAMHTPVTKRPARAALLPLLAVLALLAGCAPSGAELLEPEPREAVFPLPERHLESYTNDWGAPRPQGTHEGTDLYAPEGTTVRSVTEGTVVRAEDTGGDGWNTLGGYTVNIRADHDVGPVERGDTFYYAHMREPTPFEPGDSVEAGEKLGEASVTGGGPPGAREAGPPHLHLGWYVSPQEQQAESGARNPYPLLERLRESGGSFTVQPEGPFS